MLACRAFFSSSLHIHLIAHSILFKNRIDRALRVAITHAVLNRLGGNSKGCCSYHVFSYTRRKSVVRYTDSVMNKKRKSVTLVWRAVSTQPASSGESEFVDHTAVLDSQTTFVEAVAEPYPTVTTLEDCMEVIEDTGMFPDATSSSIALQENNELKNAEEVLADSITTSVLLNSDDNGGAGDAAEASISPGSHSVSLAVGASIMQFIKEKRELIEKETGVDLIFPSSTKKHSIVINCKSTDRITKASEMIQVVIDQAVKSPRLNYSHFISLPLAIHPELVDKLVRFQKSILQDVEYEDDEHTKDKSDADASEDVQESGKALDAAIKPTVSREHEHEKVDKTSTSILLVNYAPKARKPGLRDLHIEKSIFINPKTFHLTILMLKLWNEERIHSAMEVFQSISSQVMEALDGRPIFVRLKGLECMKGSLKKAQVLYIPVEEIGNEGRLMRACKVIKDAYIKAGLVLERDATQSLKLHATVMNTLHRKRPERSGRSKKVIPFDAIGIFEQYGLEEWGDYNIREAHLSQRFLYDKIGYYHCCASMLFPQDTQAS